ncbi:MAG: rRNA adenine N-6-methyltransferase family protein [Candidatus Hodgkinia cicadicola]
MFIDSNWVFKKLLSAGAASTISSKVVCEIGPGRGALTKFLLSCNALKLVLVEIDIKLLDVCLHLLEAYPGKFDIIFRDVMQTNCLTLVFGAKLNVIVSSLPYSVAVRLLMLLSRALCTMLIIVQREIYYKILSSYSKLSLFLMCYNVRKLFDAPSVKFLPRPSVNSVCVLMTPTCFANSGSSVEIVNVLRRFSLFNNGN